MVVFKQKHMINSSLIIFIVVLGFLFLSACSGEVIFDKKYCRKDSDCIRAHSCCDCSVGEYINKKYYKNHHCNYECDCKRIGSAGVCIDNKCQGIALDKLYCDKNKKHKIGDKWVEDDQNCSCLPGQIINCGTKKEKIIILSAKQELENYYQNIDKTCALDSDCVIKDISNCCGYYPDCVNKSYIPNKEKVRNLCKQSKSSSICGFPEIRECVCKSGSCRKVT